VETPVTLQIQLCIATSAKPKTAPTAALTFTNSSTSGYCGKDTAFCGSGCQSSFGNCNSGSGTITTNGECGSKNGETCKGFAKGECCSASGYCGSSSDHCAAGCQNSFGYATPAPAPFPLMASAVARMVGFAKASLKGTVAVQTATVAVDYIAHSWQSLLDDRKQRVLFKDSATSTSRVDGVIALC
jgi:hypothetical protein